MPPPVNPPPSNEPGAISNPRMLNRWLDINPVHALERTKTYWVVPSFEIEDQWRGYSNLVGVFNYVAPNNFTLPAFEAPDDPSYVACIMWVDDDLNVFRYKLWGDVGEVFNFRVPLYTGQLIKKNFRIEIWTTPATIDITTILVQGAGTGAVNGTYAQTSAQLWLSGGNFLITSGTAFTGNGGVLLGLNGQYNTLSGGLFGSWLVTLGAAPAPVVSATVTASSNGETQTFYTSVLGGYDYMWSSDAALTGAAALVTDFSLNDVGGVFTPPIVPTDSDSVPTTN